MTLTINNRCGGVWCVCCGEKTHRSLDTHRRKEERENRGGGTQKRHTRDRGLQASKRETRRLEEGKARQREQRRGAPPLWAIIAGAPDRCSGVPPCRAEARRTGDGMSRLPYKHPNLLMKGGRAVGAEDRTRVRYN